MSGFDWEDFRHFAALGLTLNLGLAAQRLGTSQVTVMRRVKALEASLNATLFVRRRDGHRLTESGAALLRIAVDAEDVLRAVGTLGLGDDGRFAGHLRITTTEVGANWILVPQLATMRLRYPEICFEIDSSPQANDLLNDAETLALRFHRPERGDHLIKRLGTIGYGLYAVGGASWSADRELAPYIGWAGLFGDISLARWLRATFAPHRAAAELTTLAGHIEAARRGVGVVALPDFVAAQIEGLQRFSLSTTPFALDAWLVIPRQIRNLSRVKAAKSLIEKAFEASLSNAPFV
jgi:DNA-binding transcriptional LysR family regulator